MLRRSWEIWCDGASCANWESGSDPQELRKQMARRGWTSTKRPNRDYCGGCTALRASATGLIVTAPSAQKEEAPE